jgi:hypothetical protein
MKKVVLLLGYTGVLAEKDVPISEVTQEQEQLEEMDDMNEQINLEETDELNLL